MSIHPVISVSAELNLTVRLIKDAQRNYLLMSREERRALSDAPENPQAVCISNDGDLPKPLVLEWKDTAPANGKQYTVTVKRLPDGKVFFKETTDKFSVEVVNLEIARSYEWTVATTDGQAASTFKTEDLAPRLLQFANIRNARDFGGRIGIGGRRIRQGMMFRTCTMNRDAKIVYYSLDEVMKFHEEGKLEGMGVQGESLEKQIRRGDKIDPKFIRLIKSTPTEPGAQKLNDEQRQFILDTFGVKTDIDLRGDMECYGMTGSPLGPSVKWYQWSYGTFGYYSIFCDDGYRSFREVFKILIDESNYSIVFHCSGGLDRTGTLATLLNALLGVEENELCRDYEASYLKKSSGVVDSMHRSWFEGLLKSLYRLEGNNLREKLEYFAIDLCGISMDEINKFREIMLEK